MKEEEEEKRFFSFGGVFVSKKSVISNSSPARLFHSIFKLE
jgi:hypothetical protein